MNDPSDVSDACAPLKLHNLPVVSSLSGTWDSAWKLYFIIPLSYLICHSANHVGHTWRKMELACLIKPTLIILTCATVEWSSCTRLEIPPPLPRPLWWYPVTKGHHWQLPRLSLIYYLMMLLSTTLAGPCKGKQITFSWCSFNHRCRLQKCLRVGVRVCVCTCFWSAQRGDLCVLFKPSVVRGAAIYFQSEEDNHILSLCLYIFHIFIAPFRDLFSE